MTPRVSHCRYCGCELRGVDAVADWCAAPRCAEQADAISATGSRITTDGIAEQARQARADAQWAKVIIADLDAEQQERERRREHRELYL